MSQLISSLKVEIGRVTRKEIKACVTRMNALMKQQAKDLAALRRQLMVVLDELAQLRLREGTHAGHAESTREKEGRNHEGRRFSPKGMRTHRKRLKLSAVQFAKLVGVSAPSVYAWEQGRVRPRPRQLAALLALRKMGKREIQQRLEKVGG